MLEIDDSCLAVNTVSVIIPTMCQANRADLLHRAIESIVSQSGVALDVVIVVNGDKFDDDLVANLEDDPRLRVLRRDEGNVSAARYTGLQKAVGDYFCFLDDDDEFLPNALKQRVALFSTHTDADVIVTNGFEFVSCDRALVKPQGCSTLMTLM